MVQLQIQALQVTECGYKNSSSKLVIAKPFKESSKKFDLSWLISKSPRSTLYIPALTLPFSSVFFDSFSITLLYSRRRGSWLWHSPVNTNTASICVMGVSLNLTTPIKFSLTLINTDVHSILCKVYNRVDSSNITSQTWKFYFFRFFRQKTETEFWLLYIKIPKSDYLYKYALGNLKW